MPALARRAALVATAGLLSLAPLLWAGPAHAVPAPSAALPAATRAEHRDVAVAELTGVPAATLLRHGRVLVLRPDTLEIALDGLVRRTVAVRQPLDLAELPALVGDPAYAASTGPDGVRLGAVLVQRPGTVVTVTGGRLDLADTGGAGPGRLTGTRAGLDLRGVTLTASSALGVAATPGARIVTAGLRYLHDSDITLQDVVLRGLGTPGPAGLAAVRVGSGSRVRLTSVTLDAGGRGVQLDQPGLLAVDGLAADHATGDVLGVVGGSGATISGLRTTGTGGAALRLRATTATTVSGLASTGDVRALVATDVAGLRADGVRVTGSGLLVGGRRVDLEAPVVDAPMVALQVDGGSDVAVRGGTLRGRSAVRADGQSVGVRLEGVTTQGLVAGPVTVHGGVAEPAAAPGADAAAARAAADVDGTWWGGRLRSAGGVAVVVVVGGLVLEILRGRRRGSRRDGRSGAGRADGGGGTGGGTGGGGTGGGVAGDGSAGRAPAGDGAPPVPGPRDGACSDADLVLDLGETRTP